LTTPYHARDIRSRVVAVLTGNKPDRLPFIDRMELWHTFHERLGTLPDQYRGMSLTEVHRAVGMGQQKFMPLYEIKLCGVELILTWEGEEIYHETDPAVDYFPRLYGILPKDKAGVVVAEIITPRGRLTTRQELLANMVEAGMGPYMSEHPIKSPADYPALAYIVEHAEFVSCYDELRAAQDHIGDIGFVVPMLNRIPFQQVVLDYVGEVASFYLLYDEPGFVEKIIALLDEKVVDLLGHTAALSLPYVEFSDNLEAHITNPRFFRRYCLPYYQHYSDIVHAQGKRLGSHTDGNIKPLLSLLAESGLDVCESFSPAPLTQCTFQEAWESWQALDGPIIWGGIPSPVLEAQTSEADFRRYVDHVLSTVGDKPIILGVGDMVVPVNMIERVRYIADRVEEHAIGR
jgi:hypothetical protein